MLSPNILQDPVAAVHELTASIDEINDYGSSDQLGAHFRQLAEDYSGRHGIYIEIEPIGTYTDLRGRERSLEARIIHLGQVGSGKIAYVKGGVHSNELVYRRSQEAISRLVCEHPDLFRSLGYATFIFYDADPRGTDANTWHHAGPPTFRRYMKGTYRNAAQVDWDYPTDTHETTLPATLASRQLMEAYLPDYLYAQHNADIGNWFVYLAACPSGLVNTLPLFMHAVAPQLLPSVKPDFPNAKRLGKGMYRAPTMQEAIADLGEKAASSLTMGDSSINHLRHLAAQAGKPEPGGLVPEVPYFSVAVLRDFALTDRTTKQVWASVTNRSREILKITADFLDTLQHLPSGHPDTMYRDAASVNANALLGFLESQEEVRSEAADSRLLTRSAVADEIIKWPFYCTRALGMVYRLAEKSDSPAAAAAQHRFQKETALLEQELSPLAIPPRTLTRAQTGAFLLHLAAEAEAA